MEYRNTKTGAIIDVNSELRGNWVPVEKPAAKKKEAPKKKGSTKK